MFGKDVDTSAALIHVGMATIVFLYVFFSGYVTALVSLQHQLTLILSLSFLLYSIVLLLSNYRWPGPYTVRRILTLVVDCAVISLGLLLADELALPFLGGYVWITIANGLRYGRNYLVAANLLTVLCFSLVIAFSHYWHDKLILGLGNLFWMTLLPVYFVKLLNNLQIALQQSHHANKVKSQFLANMSHELRTPLSAILGYSEMLTDDATKHKNIALATDLQKIHNAAQHLLTSINSMLELSRLEAGKISATHESFYLPDIISSIANTVQPALLLKQNDFRVQYLADIAMVNTDQLLLHNALLHLVNNANKFTNQGQISLSINTSIHIDRTTWLDIIVSDTGIGIEPDAIPHLFKPFEQADSSSTRKYEGAGLGLAITAQIVQLLAGTIRVTSKPDCGSNFYVSVPITIQLRPEHSTNSKIHIRAANQLKNITTPSAERRGKISQILMIISEPADCRIIEKYFSALDLQLIFASSVAKSLLEIHTKIPDLIVLDMRTAQHNDIKRIQELNAELAIATIPIVLLAMKDQFATDEVSNATVCLNLPLDMDALATTIITQLRRTINNRMLVVSDNQRFYTALDKVCHAIHVHTNHVDLAHFNPAPDGLAGYNILLMDLTTPNIQKIRSLKTLSLQRSNQSFRIICLLSDAADARLHRIVSNRCDQIIACNNFGLDETLLHVIDYLNECTNNYYGHIKSNYYSTLRTFHNDVLAPTSVKS